MGIDPWRAARIQCLILQIVRMKEVGDFRGKQT